VDLQISVQYYEKRGSVRDVVSFWERRFMKSGVWAFHRLLPEADERLREGRPLVFTIRSQRGLHRYGEGYPTSQVKKTFSYSRFGSGGDERCGECRKIKVEGSKFALLVVGSSSQNVSDAKATKLGCHGELLAGNPDFFTSFPAPIFLFSFQHFLRF
jgi:hypothetical protein